MKKVKKLLSVIIVLCMLVGCFSITANAALGDKKYNENEPGNNSYETAGVLQKDFTILASLPKETDDIDWYVFNLHQTSKVSILCAANFEDLIGGIVDMNTKEVLYDFTESEFKQYYIDSIVVTLPAGKYYILIADRYNYSYYKNDYTLYYDYEDPEPTLENINGEWRCVVGDYYSDMTGLVKYAGKWFYVEEGYWYSDTTELIKYNGEWLYIKNGKWDSNVTKLVKYNSKWFYIKNGKWDNTANNLIKINNKWFYIKNGKWSATTGIVKYKGQNFYIKGGKWSSSVNTLYKKSGKYFAIKNGKWYKGKSIIKYNGKKYYVNKGYAQTKYSGKVKIYSKTYKIKKGKVV